MSRIDGMGDLIDQLNRRDADQIGVKIAFVPVAGKTLATALEASQGHVEAWIAAGAAGFAMAALAVEKGELRGTSVVERVGPVEMLKTRLLGVEIGKRLTFGMAFETAGDSVAALEISPMTNLAFREIILGLGNAGRGTMVDSPARLMGIARGGCILAAAATAAARGEQQEQPQQEEPQLTFF